ncbi:MAG: 2-C-methyl-D-erythritol 2,4-cyclodiphosphate synthase [Kiritimatiellae bacterium]|nr:2-C-methyl-D-erythritol 2,4-cyclodiphosphate synthase [Kiritimatiellia bacterium]
MTTRAGIGFDAHRFVQGRPLVLGGVRIEHPVGLEGHSDADVVCHALIDALLGAAAAGDIGHHFPCADPRWRDADSLDLLRRTVARLNDAHHMRVVNVDVTVIAEQPRLEPHIPAMRASMAPVLAVPQTGVSVKATTVEGMGALGRGEGIAAMAVAVICPRDA